MATAAASIIYGNVPANNPTWEAVVSYMSGARKDIANEGKKQYSSLPLHEYLSWAISKYNELNKLPKDDYRNKVHVQLCYYELLAKHKIDVLKLFNILITKKSPAKELSKLFSHSKSTKLPYDHAHDGTCGVKIFLL